MRKPRASGDDPFSVLDFNFSSLVNPARAGMILVWYCEECNLGCKPRASGDDPENGGIINGRPG